MTFGLTSLPLRFLNRYRATGMWKRLGRLGDGRFGELLLVLSFDCDTAEDAEAAREVDARLRRMGVSAAYAVPGQLLERFQSVYESLRDRGATFLNHGYVEHTFWSEERARYESCFFYDQLLPDDMVRDIELGHASLSAFLGRSPEGFRTPHFGTFQETGQLRILHDALARLGYVYSSSTVPEIAFREGPAVARGPIWEIPVTGRFPRPLEICDSWAFFAAPDRALAPEDYVTEARALAAWVRANGLYGVLNYYADPSHVIDQPAFFEAVSVWLEIARPVSFPELCRRLR